MPCEVLDKIGTRLDPSSAMADIFVIEDIEKKVKGMDLFDEKEVEVIDLGRGNLCYNPHYE